MTKTYKGYTIDTKIDNENWESQHRLYAYKEFPDGSFDGFVITRYTEQEVKKIIDKRTDDKIILEHYSVLRGEHSDFETELAANMSLVEYCLGNFQGAIDELLKPETSEDPILNSYILSLVKHLIRINIKYNREDTDAED